MRAFLIVMGCGAWLWAGFKLLGSGSDKLLVCWYAATLLAVLHTMRNHPRLRNK